MQAKKKHEIFQRKSPAAAQAKENTQEEKEKKHAKRLARPYKPP